MYFDSHWCLQTATAFVNIAKDQAVAVPISLFAVSRSFAEHCGQVSRVASTGPNHRLGWGMRPLEETEWEVQSRPYGPDMRRSALHDSI
jgi:hypothetical protein